MSERAISFTGSPPAGPLDPVAGRWVVHRGMDAHLYGGVATGDPGIGPGPGWFGNRGPGNRGRRIFNRRGRPSPQWYRLVAVGTSIVGILVVMTILALR